MNRTRTPRTTDPPRAPGAGLHDTLLSIATACTVARHSHAIHAVRSAPAPAAPDAEPVAGPLNRTEWVHAMCESAGRANCGICWACPGEPCVTAGPPAKPVTGFHAGRFVRAARRGAIGAAELDTLIAGLLPCAVVWDRQVPGGVAPC